MLQAEDVDQEGGGDGGPGGEEEPEQDADDGVGPEVVAESHQGGADGSWNIESLVRLLFLFVKCSPPEKIATVVRARASTLGWSVMAPETILPPVLKKPMSDISSAESDSVSPLC